MPTAKRREGGPIYLEEVPGVVVFTIKSNVFEIKKVPASGYGKALETRWGVLVNGEQRWRKVYATCWSNVASHWIVFNGYKYFLKDSYFPASGESQSVVMVSSSL